MEDILQVGLIGVGLRGTNHLKNLLLREDVSITGLCDIDPVRIDLNLDLIQKAGRKKPLVFGKNDQDYRNMLELKELDAVIISTPWEWHVPMAVDAMQAGKYTGLEVSAATTLEGCWDLVNTHEATGTHLMILENVNYRRDIMAVLNMVRQGVFGELIHLSLRLSARLALRQVQRRKNGLWQRRRIRGEGDLGIQMENAVLVGQERRCVPDARTRPCGGHVRHQPGQPVRVLNRSCH